MNQRNGSVIVKVEKKRLVLGRVRSFAERKGFQEKPEFHITIIGYRQGKSIISALNCLAPEQRETKLNDVCQLIRQTDWTFSLPPDACFHVKKQDGENWRESCIQTVALPALSFFIQRLNQVLSTNLHPQPPHITLFIKGSKEGIGIETDDELLRLNPQRIL